MTLLPGTRVMVPRCITKPGEFARWFVEEEAVVIPPWPGRPSCVTVLFTDTTVAVCERALCREVGGLFGDSSDAL